ncbi:MAG TPA: cupin domain-containing protein [Candidatus Baltobacteraceae bacterium]|nr:cupin domain-containing protein [Candidatus Baltobacteraceae bacterium]
MVHYKALSARLRELRSSRRRTLERAASAAGLSASTLSRIETNARTPLLEHLVALGEVCGVALADLLPPRLSDPRVRARTRHVDGMALRLLSPTTSSRAVVEITIAKRRMRRKLQSHSGREWIYLVSGVLELTLDHEIITMREGEAAEFDTRLPHAMDAESASVTLIAIYGEEGRRVHFRAIN